jgi:hypothetical protein
VICPSWSYTVPSWRDTIDGYINGVLCRILDDIFASDVHTLYMLVIYTWR